MSRAATDVPPAPAPAPEARRGPDIAVGIAVVLCAGTAMTAWLLTEAGYDLHLIGGSALRGAYRWLLTPWTVLPVVVGTLLFLVLPQLSRRLPWRRLVVLAPMASAAWTVALALSSGGPQRLAEPLDSVYEYPHDVVRVTSIPQALADWTASVPALSLDPWTTHVAGHPPAALFAFVLLDRLGLPPVGAGAVLCIVGGVLAVPAVLVTVRAVADEAAARVVAPFVVLAPFVLWVATSADAFFAGISAWGIALLAMAAHSRGGRSVAAALVGGLLLGLTLYLSFGLAALGLVAIAVVVVALPELGWAGVARVLAVGAVGVLAVVGLFYAGGYWWLDGLQAASDRVRTGPSYADRPLVFFLVSNLAALVVMVGPAAVAGLGALRRTRLALLPVAALAGVLVNDATGHVRGETERIWLPFAVWLLVATAYLPARQRRLWLGAAAVLALVVEIGVRTEW